MIPVYEIAWGLQHYPRGQRRLSRWQLPESLRSVFVRGVVGRREP